VRINEQIPVDAKLDDRQSDGRRQVPAGVGLEERLVPNAWRMRRILLACEHASSNGKKHDTLSRSTHFQCHQLKPILPS
jgi:hypothetical protein